MADQFSIGGVPLDPQRVNKSFLRDMWKAAKKAETTEGKDEALAALEELGKTGEISSEAFAAVDAYRKGVNEEYRADKDRFWATWRENGKNFKDPALQEIRKEMGVSGAFLIQDLKLQTALREATALVAVQAAAGGSFGPAAVVANYAAYANGKTWDKKATRKTEALLETYKALQSGDSPMITEGNRVKQVHREELWRTLGAMTGEAVESGKKGQPLPITAQYYELTSPEMVGNLAAAAKAGSPLRLNLDPGRLSYPSKDANNNQYFDVDDIPHKMRTVLQFTGLKGCDVGVSIFPIKQELDHPEDLMHRKVLRVGDKVLMSGMNANNGSGENIDAGYVIEGPAAARYTDNVRRDIKASVGAGYEEIWGADHIEKMKTADMRVGRRGITAILDTLSGPSEAGQDLPKTANLAELEALAKKAGVDLKELFDVPAADYERVVGDIAAGKGKASLSKTGKEKFMEVIERAVASTQTQKNKKALGDIDLPSDKAVGKTRVDIADQPTEREVLTLQAINEAEEFIFLPGFVVTRAVAAALVAKKKEMEAKGGSIDIRVVADSGIYPDGGTPNSWGMNYLDDHGIPTKWSKLTRSGWHDIKIHAKQMLTDKGEIAGSTNFTNKGFQDNWETSAYVHFDQSDKESIELREASKKQFLDLWENDSYDLSAKDLAAYDNRFAPAEGKEWIVEQERDYGTKKIIQGIEKFEIESGQLVAGFMQDPGYKAKYDEMLKKGYSEGDAAFLAADQHFGAEKFQAMRDQLPANQELLQTEQRVNTWKAKYGDRDGASE
jgi:phosphatidylserine/phosphatidylglycerophosphate/cardiolipin synthase-like enzyme